MIFSHSFNEKITLANQLYNLIFAHMKNNRERMIRIFTLVLEPDVKEEYLENFYKNHTRI